MGKRKADGQTVENYQANNVNVVRGDDAPTVQDWLQLWFFPETMVTRGMLPPMGNNTKPWNPQNTFDEHIADYPQIPVLAPSGHLLNGIAGGDANSGTITDASGNYLELLNIVTNKSIFNSIREGKNWNGGGSAAGAWIPYTWLSEQGVPNFLLGAMAGPTSGNGVGAAWEDLNPSAAIYDTSILTQLASCCGTGSANNWPSLTSSVTGASVLASFFNIENAISPHGLVMGAGQTGGGQNALFRWIWTDTCDQASTASFGTIEPYDLQANTATTQPAFTVSTGTTNITNSYLRSMLSAGIMITTGDHVSAPGYGDWQTGDKLAYELIGHNENEPVIYWSGVLEIKATANGDTNYPLLWLPAQYRDYCRLRVGVVTAATSISNSTAINNANNSKRTIKVMQASCGGYYAHRMLPQINSLNKLSLWTQLQVLSNVVDAGNFSAQYAGAGKVVFRQPDVGTYWQEESGSDSRACYSFNAAKRFQEEDTLIHGERGCLLWEDDVFMQPEQCVKIPSGLYNTSLISASGNNATSAKFFAVCDLDNMVYAVQVLRSPGVSGSASNVGGIQPAQPIELHFTAAWMGKTEEQILAVRFPKGNRETIRAACKIASQMKQAGPSIESKKLGMQYYAKTIGWRERCAKRGF